MCRPHEVALTVDQTRPVKPGDAVGDVFPQLPFDLVARSRPLNPWVEQEEDDRVVGVPIFLGGVGGTLVMRQD